MDTVWTGANPSPQADSSLSSIDVNELRSEHKSCEWSKTVLHKKRLGFPGQFAPCPFTENILSAYKRMPEQKKDNNFWSGKIKTFILFFLIYKVQGWAFWEH